MMIPYGYKQTEVGVIPEDWSVDTIGAVTLSVTNGGNYKNSAQISLYPLIKMGNISRGYINLKKIEYVIGFPPSENDRLTYGDVLLNTRNTPELVGKVAIWKNELSRAYFNSNLLRFNFKLEKSDPFFMNLVLNTEQVISEFRNIAKGTTSVAAIYPQDMLKVKIIIPPLQEQQRIAEALSDVDGMISSLEKLVAKYKSIKTACLQQMFPQNGETVPRMRLPGFTDAWEQRKLGDMMNVTSVKRIHQADWTDSGVRFLRARDIVAAAKNEEPDDYLYISKEKYEEYSALSGKVSVSDLLVTGVGTIGVPYLVRNLEPLYFKDGNIIWFQNSDKIDGKFLFYSFSADQIQGFINESAGIGTVGTYTIESGKKTPISLPNQIEQAKVGEFFQQLDHLVILHQRKLEKLQKIKQGMMQQLLTGKIRLV